MPAEVPPPADLAPDIRVTVNMGRKTSTGELNQETPVVTVLGETSLFGIGAAVVPLDVDSSTMPKEGTLLTQETWVAQQEAKYNLVSPEGVKNPQIVQELLGEGYTAEELAEMTNEQFYHVVAGSLNGLPNLEAVTPTSVALEASVPEVDRTGVPVTLDLVEDFVAYIVAGGSFTADGEGRTLRYNSDTGKYTIIKADGTTGVLVGSIDRVKQMIASKTAEQPGRFTY